MSDIINYDNYSDVYGESRKPVGIDVIKKVLLKFEAKKVLDFGCGVGNYSNDLCNDYEVTAIDGSNGMLGHVSEMCKKINFKIDDSNSIDVSSDSHDAIIINQVLHHLNSKTLYNLLTECKRILKTGGILYINHNTYSQLKYGWWWLPYFPQGVLNKYIARFPFDIEDKLMESDFRFHGRFIIKDVMQKDDKHNFVFDKAYRDGDSVWSILSEDELNDTLYKIKNDKFIDRHIEAISEIRNHIGQSTSIIFLNN